MIPGRVVAVDWSGAASEAAQRKHIVAAELTVTDGAGDLRSVTLQTGRTRDELIDWLVAERATRFRSAVIGFDFSFALPASFSRARGVGTGPELWKLVAKEGEQWLRASPEPFWGRPGKRRPAIAEADALRQTERAINVHGIRPKSTFQTGGAGAPGTGSLRGMPLLGRLREAGYAIWPFEPVMPDAPRLPMVVEIYPRLLTGPVQKSNPEKRRKYLEGKEFDGIPEAALSLAEASEDAFDALVSALQMARHAASFARLPTADRIDRIDRLEGRIWQPDWQHGADEPPHGNPLPDAVRSPAPLHC